MGSGRILVEIAHFIDRRPKAGPPRGVWSRMTYLFATAWVAQRAVKGGVNAEALLTTPSLTASLDDLRRKRIESRISDLQDHTTPTFAQSTFQDNHHSDADFAEFGPDFVEPAHT